MPARRMLTPRSRPARRPPRRPPRFESSLNLLHGLFCPSETDSCQASDRVQIFAGVLEAADCPDLVGLQEIGARLEELLTPILARVCNGDYTIA